MIDHERIERLRAAEIAYELAEYPEYQAEAIANHYAKFAQLSVDLRHLIRLKKDFGESPSTDALINRLVGEFKRHHLMDFGIRLGWNKSEYPSSPS